MRRQELPDSIHQRPTALSLISPTPSEDYPCITVGDPRPSIRKGDFPISTSLTHLLQGLDKLIIKRGRLETDPSLLTTEPFRYINRPPPLLIILSPLRLEIETSIYSNVDILYARHSGETFDGQSKFKYLLAFTLVTHYR